MTTTNFADFGWRERKLAADLLTASCKQGFPEDFSDNGVVIMMNRNSGNVFFTNDEYEVAMMNGDDLESFYITPYHGHEGFADELKEMYEQDGGSWNQMDINYLIDLGIIEANYCCDCEMQIIDNEYVVIDDEKYCMDCVDFCDSCNNYVRSDMTRVDYEDDVCEDCLRRYYIICDCCGKHVFKESEFEVDGEYFCSDCYNELCKDGNLCKEDLQ